MRALVSVLLRSMLCVSLVGVCSNPASAQFKAGVQGTVTDSSGAVIPGASVTLISRETGQSRQVVTSDDGFYRISGLPPGRYSLTAEHPGFKKQNLENIQISAEAIQGLDFKLETGDVVESVTVTADSSEQLKTENPNIDRAISREEITRIPQFGRDVYELARLTPGVFGNGARSGSGASVGLPNTTGPGGSNTSIFQTENQVPISANGQRLSANSFEVDGVSVNSLTWGGAAVLTPNQESVKEVRVLSSTYSAEDGRNSGAQIKVVTENGTNQLHGSGLFKYNSPKLNSFNKFGGVDAPPVRVDNLIRQFGGSLGGPVVKDRLFFFFSYEGLRNNTSNYTNTYIETPQYRSLVQQIRPGGVTARVFGMPGLDPRIVSVLPVNCTIFGNRPCQVVSGGLDIGSPGGSLGRYVPLNNRAGGGLDGIPDFQYARLVVPNQVSGDQYNGRVDLSWSPLDQFAVITYFTRNRSLGGDAAGQSRPIGDILSKRFNPAITVTYLRTLSATMLNEARFNFTRFGFNEIDSNANVNFGIPRIEVEDLPFDRIRFGAPRGEGTPGIFAENTFDFRDTFTKVLGNHGLKFGMGIRWEQSNNNLAGGARPDYSFTGLWNLANDTPIFEAINADPRTGLPADAQRYFRTRDYSVFAQDDWKVRPNLTLNIGLRWEYYSPLKEIRGQMSNLVLGPNGLTDAKVVVVDQFYKPDRNNFAPRLGFAWSPGLFGDKLALRGGFGISYNRLPLAPFLNSRGNPPFFARYNLCCGTAGLIIDGRGSPFAGGQILYALGSSNSPFSFPVNPALGQGINPATGSPRSGAVEIYGAPPEEPNAYVYTYSLDVQYELPFRLVASIGYQGSASHKLIRLVNQLYLYKQNPAWFAVYFPTPDVNANYHALNARLTHRFAHGVQLDAVYRWSKSIDTLSYEGPGFVTNQSYPQDQRFERGPSDYDVRHYFVLSGLWDLPVFRNRKDWLGKAFGGFQINGLWTANTGFPWTPLFGLCASTPGGTNICPARPVAYSGGALDDTGNDAFLRPGGNFPGGGAKYFDPSTPGVRPPGIGRNVFRGPRYSSLDLSLVKRTGLPKLPALGESANIEVRFNFFNAFNQLNLAPFGFFTPSTDINNPNFGRASSGLSGRVIEIQTRLSF